MPVIASSCHESFWFTHERIRGRFSEQPALVFSPVSYSTTWMNIKCVTNNNIINFSSCSCNRSISSDINCHSEFSDKLVNVHFGLSAAN